MKKTMTGMQMLKRVSDNMSKPKKAKKHRAVQPATPMQKIQGTGIAANNRFGKMVNAMNAQSGLTRSAGPDTGNQFQLPVQYSRKSKAKKARKPKGARGRAAVRAVGQTKTTGNFAKIARAKGKGAAIGAYQNKLAKFEGKKAPFQLAKKKKASKKC